MRSVIELDRTERRVLEQLNAGGSPDASVTRADLDKLIEAGLVAESEIGAIQITPRGQLALARWRFRNLPRPRYVVFGHAKPRYNLWQRLFRQHQ